MDVDCICTKYFQLFISIHLLVYVFSLHNYFFLEKNNYLEIYYWSQYTSGSSFIKELSGCLREICQKCTLEKNWLMLKVL